MNLKKFDLFSKVCGASKILRKLEILLMIVKLILKTMS